MKPSNILLGAILLASLAAATAQGQTHTASSAAQLKTAQSALAGITPTFIENRGQWNREARFLSRFNGLDLWVTDRSIVYDIYGIQHDASASRRVGNVVRMNFVGGTAGTAVQTGTPRSGTYNYFYGKDQSKWATGVHAYDRTSIQNIYKGIDAVIYVDGGMPRYDLVVAPGADPSAVRVNYEGATGVRVDRTGDLVLSTSMGELRQQQLFAYQLVDGVKRKVECAFTMKANGTVGFDLGRYDAARPLVIDPLVYSSYLGGSGNDEAKSVGTDTTGQIFVAGNTFSADFPIKAGSYQTNYGGSGTGTGEDVFVMRINPALTPSNQVIYATYLGGVNDDVVFDLAVDDFRSAYVAGTADGSFPTLNSLISVSGRGTFAAKLSADGTALLYSTFVCDGAAYNEGAIALDSRRQLYITGTTTTGSLATSTGAFQNSLNGTSDVFVAMLNLNGNGYRYATYLGGTGDDIATGITLDANYVYVTGRTTSADFPFASTQPYDATYNGGTDAFVARLDTAATGSAQLTYATYIGGADYDAATGVGVDRLGRIYVTGATSSANYPTKNAYQSTYGGKAVSALLGDAFLAKLDPGVLPASQLQFSTYIGGAASDAATGIAVDASGNSFITGWTASATYPTTLNAIDTSFGGDSSDAFVTKISPAGALLYSTFLGGTGGDKSNAIAIDNKANIYVAGSTISTNYPTTNAALFRTIVGTGNTDAFVTKMTILQVLTPNGGDTLCAGVNNTITWTGGTSTNYDIYQSSNGGQTYNPIALNVVGNTYTWSIPALFPAGSRYRIKVMVSNGTENDFSDSNFVINTAPRITLQPSDMAQPTGGSATFSAVAAGTPTPTVQWQVDKGAGYTNIAGATSSTLTLTNVQPSQNGWRYRAVFTNSCSVATSNAATLTVFAVAVTSPNGGEQFCAGSQQTITWTATATSGPYDLYLLDGNTGVLTTIATGVTGNSYNWTIPATLLGNQYRVQIRLATAQTGDQSDTTFTVKRTPVFVAQPIGQTALKGGSASFTVSFNETPAPTVQWEVNINGTWTPISGATGGTLTLTNVQTAQNGLQYRAIATNACGVSTSQTATLTVTDNGGLGVDDATTGNGALRLSIAPNPNVGNGMIRFTLPRAGRVELTLADINGNVVSRLADATMTAGDHAVPLNGASLPNGVYLVDLRLGGVHSTVKVTVAK